MANRRPIVLNNAGYQELLPSGDQIVGDATQTEKGLMSASDKVKIDGVEAGATADQSGAEIKAAYEQEANAYTDAKNTKLAGIETGATGDQSAAEIRVLVAAADNSNVYTDADSSKLAGIESGATGDLTGAEIKSLYEAETSAYTDTKDTKLTGIEAGATADQTGAEIKALYEAETGAYTDTKDTKLTGIEDGATADQTNAEIRSAVDAASDSNVFTDDDHTKLGSIESGAQANVAHNLSYTASSRALDISNGTGITLPEVTTSDAGLASSTDKSKLDDIEVGATADQTAAEIRSLVDSASNSNVFTDAQKAKVDDITSANLTDLDNLPTNLAGKADLDGNGKVVTSQIPDLAITQFLGTVSTVSNLTTLSGQLGDFASVTNTGILYVIVSNNGSSASDWLAMQYPASTTNIGYVASTRAVTSNTGTGFTFPEVAVSGNSGLMTGAQASKLQGIAAGAEVNVGTDLTYDASTRTVESSTGADATIPHVVSSGSSGLISGTDKAKLDAIQSAAQVNVGLDGVTTISGNSDNNITLGTDKIVLNAGTGSAHFDGNVGIGTSSPDAKLNIKQGTEAISDGIRLTRSNGNASYTHYIDTSSKYNIVNSSPGNADHTFLTIASDGNVGIGTTTPATRLEVKNNDNMPGGTIQRWTADTGSNVRACSFLAPETDDLVSPFTFKTNNSWNFRIDTTDALTIAANASVGIGTTSPSQKLEVASTAPRIRITDNDTTASTATSYLEFYGSDARAGVIYTDSSGLNVRADNTGGGKLSFWTGTSSKMLIDASGNVGINTTDPKEKLDVNGDIYLSSTNEYVKFAVGNSGTESGLLAIAQDPSVNRAGILFKGAGNNQSTELAFSTSDSNTTMAERMCIKNTGNVGINTLNPSEILHVDGKIRAENTSTSDAAQVHIVNGTGSGSANDASLKFGSANDGGTSIQYAEASNHMMTFNVDGGEYIRLHHSDDQTFPRIGILTTTLDNAELNFGGSEYHSGGLVTFKNQVTIDQATSIALNLNKTASTDYTGISFSEAGDERFKLYVQNQADGSLALQARKNGANLVNVFAVDNNTGVLNFSTAPTISDNAIYHAGSTNVDADTLSGKSLVSGASTADSVVGRNSSGDIYARLFRPTFGNTGSISTGAGIAFRNEVGPDNYIRFCSDMDVLKGHIGVSPTDVVHITEPTDYSTANRRNEFVTYFNIDNTNSPTGTSPSYFTGITTALVGSTNNGWQLLGNTRNSEDLALYARKLGAGTWGNFTEVMTTDYVQTRNAALNFADSTVLRFGNQNDFQMNFNGSTMVFRNYQHATGNIVFQGENTAGTNQNLIQMKCDATNTYVRLYSGNSEKLRTVTGGITVYGNLTASGNVTSNSDIHLKKDIKVIRNPLDKVSELRGITFDRKDVECDRQTGLIAQEVEAVLPEAVETDEDGIMSVAYGNLVGLLIESIKELKGRVEELENKSNLTE